MLSLRRVAAVAARRPGSRGAARAYHQEVIDHFEKPLNVGSMDKNDPSVGTGLVGAPACGDVMKLQIKIDDDGNIVDAKFKTFGCGSARAPRPLGGRGGVCGGAPPRRRAGADALERPPVLGDRVELRRERVGQGPQHRQRRGHHEQGDRCPPQPAPRQAPLLHARGGRDQRGHRGLQKEAGEAARGLGGGLSRLSR